MRTSSFLFFGFIFLNTYPALAESEKHSHHFAADVEAFHAILSPLWHAAEGAERLANACNEASNLRDSARAIKSKSNKSLSKSLKAFSKQCKKDQSSAADAFTRVHDEFHHLIEH